MAAASDREAASDRGTASVLDGIFAEREALIPDLESLTEDLDRQRSLIGRLRSLREQSGKTQSEIAERMHTTQPAVARFEAGDVDPKMSTVARYARAVGFALEWSLPDDASRQAISTESPQSDSNEREPTTYWSGKYLDDAGAVLQALASIYALGAPAGDTTVYGTGAEKKLLHLTVDDGAVFLPVFTQPELMRTALERNPEWRELSVVHLNGGDLLSSIDDDVAVVIDPWTPSVVVDPGGSSYDFKSVTTSDSSIPEWKPVDASGVVMTEAPRAVSAGDLVDG
jgi:transcriptional regulator with XRE-family HTH domain